VINLEFSNSRCDGSWGGQIGSGPCESTTESAKDSVRIVLVVKCVLVELDAFGDGSADSIYLGDQIVSRFNKATGHPGKHGHYVEVLRFGNLRGDGVCGVRSDLTSVKTLPPLVKGLEVGFLGTVASGKLPKVNEKPVVASIWSVTLAEKTTPVLTSIELDV